MKPSVGDEIAKGLAPRLLAWYDENARDLPWRRVTDPYAILVSEFMLQQTQVQTVIPYFTAFMARFPDVRALAAASVDEVLALWQGLGYYRRARHLHQAAQAIVARHDGVVPRSYQEVRALPGVGEYTAAAVLSIAFDLPHPVLDGNVARVVARLLTIDDPVDQAPAKRRIRAFLERAMPARRCGDFNQALMELGATLCTPLSPRCGGCPVAQLCRARMEGRAAALPRKAGKERVRTEERTVAVVWRRDAVLVRRRPDEGLLGGLWEFPHRLGRGQDTVKALLAEEIGLGAAAGTLTVRPLGRVEHRFSHLLWLLEAVEVELGAASEAAAAGGEESAGPAMHGAGWAAEAGRAAGGATARWVPPAGVDALPLPRAMERVWSLARKRRAAPQA